MAVTLSLTVASLAVLVPVLPHAAIMATSAMDNNVIFMSMV
jgi:hypothetical protein